MNSMYDQSIASRVYSSCGKKRNDVRMCGDEGREASE